jgi:hypothetical protein
MKQRKDAAAKRKSKGFQTGMAAFKRAGITSASDVARDGKSVAGKDSATHQKLIAAIRMMGGKVGRVEEDGSVVATLPGGKKITLGAPKADGKFFDSRGTAWDARTYSLENGKAVKRSKKK